MQCLNVINCLIVDWNLRILCCGDIWWWGGEVNRKVKKIVMEFRRRGFVVLVRYFGEIIIRNKILSEFLIAVCGFRLKE